MKLGYREASDADQKGDKKADPKANPAAGHNVRRRRRSITKRFARFRYRTAKRSRSPIPRRRAKPSSKASASSRAATRIWCRLPSNSRSPRSLCRRSLQWPRHGLSWPNGTGILARRAWRDARLHRVKNCSRKRSATTQTQHPAAGRLPLGQLVV